MDTPLPGREEIPDLVVPKLTPFRMFSVNLAEELLASANTAGCLSKDGQVEARSGCIPGTGFFKGLV